jgi:NhaA family Na+:H+ antiporter
VVLPVAAVWPILGGAAFLGGIGFTMALFTASLGLSGDLLVEAEIGVIMGSFCSAVTGMLILVAVSKRA